MMVRHVVLAVALSVLPLSRCTFSTITGRIDLTLSPPVLVGASNARTH